VKVDYNMCIEKTDQCIYVVILWLEKETHIIDPKN